MKIGFVVHFFDFRNDVRRVIEQVSRQHETVLFAAAADGESMQPHLPRGIVIRTIQERINSWRNKIAEQAFRFFGVLPGSVQNYYLMEIFKISLIGNRQKRKQARQLLELAMKMPRWLSYDAYLNRLGYSGQTQIADIDLFILFTNISDDYLLARLIRERKNILVYVYSWDHPCKHTRYSQRVAYQVWHEGIAQDLRALQRVSNQSVRVLGASQFAYIHQYLRDRTGLPAARPYPGRYFYFGCAVGLPELVRQEVDVIGRISRQLQALDPTVLLVVRPYPVLSDWSYYEELSKLPNVRMDDQFRSRDLSVSDAHIMEKYDKIAGAQAFFHLGTTMGLEACFLATPSVIIDFEEFRQNTDLLSLYNFVHQYQNEKYLLLEAHLNVVKTEAGLAGLIQTALLDPASLLAYNQQVVEGIPLKDFPAIAHDLVALQ